MENDGTKINKRISTLRKSTKSNKKLTLLQLKMGYKSNEINYRVCRE